MAKASNELHKCCLAVVMVSVVRSAVATVFIFGDSTVDVGTNNFLEGSRAIANFPYNGIDFPNSVPTGRFSNGYNLADQLAMLFGYEMSPKPYLYLLNQTSDLSSEIVKGINFASGGSGILDPTGQKLWNKTVSLGEQIEQFRYVCGNITKGNTKIITNATYIISVGSNDLMDPFRLGSNVTKGQLVPLLQSTYHQHLSNLYKMGARKFGVVTVGPIGCCPSMRAMNKTQTGQGGCLRSANEFARAFYKSVEVMLKNLSLQLPSFKYSLADTYTMSKFILKNYRGFGFNETIYACCGSGDYNGGGACDQRQNPNLCQNRSNHLFWDLYHLTQSATNLSATSLYYGFLNFVKPITFKQLADIPL